jgi:hypothetical protein
MRTILASIVLLALPQFSAAQPAGSQDGWLSLGLAGGPRGYLSGTEQRTGAFQLFVRMPLTPAVACEGEIGGGGGADRDRSLPEMERGTPVVTHFAADLGLNLVYRTPGRVGIVASAGPGLYIEQRDTELRDGSKDDPEVLERDNDYTFGAQASLGIDLALGSAGLFTVGRYEVRALRATEKLANWQVLVGVRFRFSPPW